MAPAEQMRGTGVKALARELEVSASAVRRAARDGRLPTSTKYSATGSLVILDPVQAKAEWEAHTRPRIGIDSEAAKRRRRAAAAPAASGDRPSRRERPSPPVAALLDLRALLATLHGRTHRALQASARHAPASSAAPWKALFADWDRIPDVLTQLEDGMVAAGVPLLAKDMPPPTEEQETAQ